MLFLNWKKERRLLTKHCSWRWSAKGYDFGFPKIGKSDKARSRKSNPFEPNQTPLMLGCICLTEIDVLAKVLAPLAEVASNALLVWILERRKSLETGESPLSFMAIANRRDCNSLAKHFPRANKAAKNVTLSSEMRYL